VTSHLANRSHRATPINAGAFIFLNQAICCQAAHDAVFAQGIRTHNLRKAYTPTAIPLLGMASQ